MSADQGEDEYFGDAARIYERADIGGRLVLGAHPAVLVVDLQHGFTEEGGPLGADLSEAVAATRRLLDVARARNIPALFTAISYGQAVEAGLWARKVPGLVELRAGSRWVEIDRRLARQGSEPVIHKHGASALHGTDLPAILRTLRADTIVLCGATTSGCVRATAVDLMQEAYPVLVPAECCGDRAQAPHAAALFDMSAKYADVVSLDEALDYLQQLP